MSLFTRLLLVAIIAASVVHAAVIPAPKDVLGFTPGDDRKLASWAQTVDYFQKLGAASDRVKFEQIGKSTNDNPFVVAYISAPENLANLEKYKQIQAKLADPRLIKSNDAAARNLIKQGKTIVLITCGVHSNEVGSYLSSMLIAHRLASSNDAATLKILRETIVILVPSLNPDGVDIIKNWYDKMLGTKFEGTEPPELYNKYVGHDDNRDWYAFTQAETQITVDKIHNVWHPQIVHDIHQQGETGSRMFLPPYLPPVEPNVPKQIVAGYTELGRFMADGMRAKNFAGITTDSTYDAWSPSRAYSHYHGGVRILSETASCKLATPIVVKFDQLKNGLGYNPQQESPNFAPVWKGGEWHLRDITNYMTTAAFLLLNHAADNREKWLTRFYEIGKEAVRPRKNGELFAFIFKPINESSQNENVFSRISRFNVNSNFRQNKLLSILTKAGVEIDSPNAFQVASVKYPKGTSVIKIAQPYGSFAKAVIETQKYPDLKDEKGSPIQPYDVTAQTLPLLMGVKSKFIYEPFFYKKPGFGYGLGSGNGCGCSSQSRFGIYRSSIPSIDEGWTRWIFEGTNDYKTCCAYFENILDNEIQQGVRRDSDKWTETIIFPDQSPNQILNGFPKGAMPDEYTGGVGKEGVENLRKFVEAGGTLVFLNRASSFAIEQFNLPVRDVTKDLPRKDFYIPGSILRTELDTTSKIAAEMAKQSIAWFENSSAFEITNAANVKIIARYPVDSKNILLSGYALGADKIAGKAALVEVSLGKGKIILFGFRPQYRGQSLATFPLLFNAITAK